LIGLFIGPIVLAVGWELLAAWMRDEAGRGLLVDEVEAIEADRQPNASEPVPSSARPRTSLP